MKKILLLLLLGASFVLQAQTDQSYHPADTATNGDSIRIEVDTLGNRLGGSIRKEDSTYYVGVNIEGQQRIFNDSTIFLLVYDSVTNRNYKIYLKDISFNNGDTFFIDSAKWVTVFSLDTAKNNIRNEIAGINTDTSGYNKSLEFDTTSRQIIITDGNSTLTAIIPAGAAGNGGDNWGIQVAQTDNTIIGDGTAGSPLGVDSTKFITNHNLDTAKTNIRNEIAGINTDTSGYNKSLVFDTLNRQLSITDGESTLSETIPDKHFLNADLVGNENREHNQTGNYLFNVDGTYQINTDAGTSSLQILNNNIRTWWLSSFDAGQEGLIDITSTNMHLRYNAGSNNFLNQYFTTNGGIAEMRLEAIIGGGGNSSKIFLNANNGIDFEGAFQLRDFTGTAFDNPSPFAYLSVDSQGNVTKSPAPNTAASTDTTINGDGTAGNPLGIDTTVIATNFSLDTAKTNIRNEIAGINTDTSGYNKLLEFDTTSRQIILTDGNSTLTAIIPAGAAGNGGDNWGIQVAQADNTLIGDGTAGSPLGVDSTKFITNYNLDTAKTNIRNEIAGINTDTSGYNKSIVFDTLNRQLSITDGESTLSETIPDKHFLNADLVGNENREHNQTGDYLFNVDGTYQINTDAGTSSLQILNNNIRTWWLSSFDAGQEGLIDITSTNMHLRYNAGSNNFLNQYFTTNGGIAEMRLEAIIGGGGNSSKIFLNANNGIDFEGAFQLRDYTGIAFDNPSPFAYLSVDSQGNVTKSPAPNTAASTDTTINGDGTAGNPLGIDTTLIPTNFSIDTAKQNIRNEALAIKSGLKIIASTCYEADNGSMAYLDFRLNEVDVNTPSISHSSDIIFTPSVNLPIADIVLFLKQQNAGVSDNVSLELRTGSRTGPIIATSVNQQTVGNDFYSIFAFNFNSTNLFQNTNYYLVLNNVSNNVLVSLYDDFTDNPQLSNFTPQDINVIIYSQQQGTNRYVLNEYSDGSILAYNVDNKNETYTTPLGGWTEVDCNDNNVDPANNATITLKQGATTIGFFTNNQAADKEIIFPADSDNQKLNEVLLNSSLSFNGVSHTNSENLLTTFFNVLNSCDDGEQLTKWNSNWACGRTLTLRKEIGQCDWALINYTLINTDTVAIDTTHKHIGDCGNPVVISSDLSLNMVVDNSTPDENANVSYTLTVTNNGPDDATGVNVSDVLPFTFVSSDCGFAANNWSIGNLANGASISCIITVTTSGTATVTNTATVSSTTNDPTAGNNSASVDVTPQQTGANTLCSGTSCDNITINWITLPWQALPMNFNADGGGLTPSDYGKLRLNSSSFGTGLRGNDINPAGTDLEIDWGDGNTDIVSGAFDGAGDPTVWTMDHTWANNATYIVKLKVVGSSGSEGGATFRVDWTDRETGVFCQTGRHVVNYSFDTTCPTIKITALNDVGTTSVGGSATCSSLAGTKNLATITEDGLFEHNQDFSVTTNTGTVTLTTTNKLFITCN